MHVLLHLDPINLLSACVMWSHSLGTIYIRCFCLIPFGFGLSWRHLPFALHMSKQHLQQVWGRSYVMVTTRGTDEHTDALVCLS